MAEYTSELISDTSNTTTNNELTLSFEVVNGGTETVYIEDKLLTNYEVAQARAENVLLEEGHIHKRISINTYHIDNLHIGDIFQADGLLYKTISINEKIQGAKVSMDIVGERYAQPATFSWDGVLVIKSEHPDTSFYNMVEFNGYIYATSGGESGGVYRSILDSDVWSVVYNHPTEEYIYSYCVHKGYQYVGTGDSLGQIYRSSNGTDWTLAYESASLWISSLISHSDGYIYAGGDGRIHRSLDGVSWTQVWYGIVDEVYDLCSCTDGYVYASTGYLGQLYRSSNGTDWTLVYDFGEEENELMSFIYTGGYYYVTTGYAAKIYRSSDLITWVEVHSTPDYFLLSIMVHSNGYLYVGSGGTGCIYRSLDGITWNTYLDTGEDYVYKLFQSSTGRFYAAAPRSGRIYADTLVQSGGE